MAALFTLWCIGKIEFGIGNDDKQKPLMKCGWSETIQIRNIYTSNKGYTIVEDMDGKYYSAGYNGSGACTVNDKSRKILTMTPITYFKQHNIKIVQVFVSNMGDAPFWKAEDGSIYTSCSHNSRGCVGIEVDKNKRINKIPFLSQLSIKKMVSGCYCSIAICNDGSVYSTGTGWKKGENGLGAKGVGNHGVFALDCSGNVYQWGMSLTGGSDILCPQYLKLEEKVVSIETGSSHCICRTERGHFISIGSGDDGECCRDNVDDESPQIINEWILNQIKSKQMKILSVTPGTYGTFILVSDHDTDDIKDAKVSAHT